MTNTYLLEVIKALQPIKQQEMTLLLNSPLFNRGGNAKEMAKLYQIIMDTAPDFPEELLNKEKVYFQIFSEKKVVDRKLDKLMGDLNKVLRIYALSKRYLSEDNEYQQQIDWATWLRERGLPDRSRQVISRLISQKENEKTESLELYRTNWLIAEEEHMWQVTYNRVKGDLHIPELTHHLDLFYQNYRIDRINRYLLQQKGTPLPELKSIESNENLYHDKSNLLLISKKIFNVLMKGQPSAEETRDLMQVLQNNEKILSFQALDHSYAYLRNFCALLINGGRLDFIPILHEIHIDNLSRGYFFINGEISPNSYLNLVLVATRAKEYEWAKKFTEEYKGLIVGGDEDRFFYRLNLAQCFFAENEFKKSLELLPDTPSNSHYHHVVRCLELKNYYELDSDLLIYKIDAFRKFMERTAPKNIAVNLIKMDLNFLNILTQLIQSPKKDKVRSAKLITRIESKKLLAERTWLLEKARELG